MYRNGNTDQNKLVVAVADSGEGPGGHCPPPRLFLNQGRKKFFWRPGPPFLRVWMTGMHVGVDLVGPCCQSHTFILLAATINSF